MNICLFSLIFFLADRPGFLDFAGKSKHDAWSAKTGNYICEFTSFLLVYVLYSPFEGIFYFYDDIF